MSGFVQRKWRWLGVDGAPAVEAVVEVLRELVHTEDLTDSHRRTLQDALAGNPERETVLAAVRGALELQTPQVVLHQMRTLTAAGVPWLTGEGATRCRLVCSTAPGVEMESGAGRTVSGGPAFSLFATAVTRGAVPLPNRHLDEVLPWAPLTVLDDLVDHGGVLAEDEPWKGRSGDDERYLRARLAPGRTSSADAEALGWEEYRRRRMFLDGECPPRADPPDVWDVLFDVCADGNLGQLDELDELLPRTQQIQLRDIRSGRIHGEWSREILADQGLWLLLSELWNPAEPVNPKRGTFHALVAIKRACASLKAGDFADAVAQAELFEKGAIGKPASDALRQEALNIRSYAAAVRGGLAEAEKHAEAATLLGPESEGNLRLVRAWRSIPKNQRACTNPFLDLDLDHGSTRWEKRSRELFREYEGDPGRQAGINHAEERIRAATTADAGTDVFFRVPLDPERCLMPDETPTHLVPPLPPMPRRTEALSGVELESVRERAAVELLHDFRVTPPRLDRHVTGR